MKKLLLLIVLGFGTMSFALSQSFSTSMLPSGQSVGNAERSVTSVYMLTQSSSQAIVAGNSVSCNAGGLHTNNSYMRVFDLPFYGIAEAINITNVEFGIEQAVGIGGIQPAVVNIYTLDLPVLLFANLTLIASQPVNIPDQSLTIMNVPVSASIPAGSTLVVEIFTPNGQVAGNSFFIGSNSLPETAPSYLAAADCGVPEPLMTAALGFPGMHTVMNVYADPANPSTVPVATWAIILGVVLMTGLVIYRFWR